MPSETYAIAFVLALVGLLALWSRWRAATKRRLEVVETAALGQGRAVAIIQAGGKRLLIGVTGHSISTLAELDAADWSSAAESQP
jgi:flagellar biogenesis protein FliO